MENKIFARFGRDMLSGLIVFLVALPLCLGIAQACGVSPFAGIVAGVIGGVVVGTLSGSALSVSGPAAGLIAIVVTAMSAMPFSYLLCAVLIAGVLQLLAGAAEMGGVADYIPSNVIEGMLAGIGITIVIHQAENAVGFDRKAFLGETETGFSFVDIADLVAHIEPGAVLISSLGLALMVLWSTKAFKKSQLFPVGLLVVVAGVVINQLLKSAQSEFALEGNTHLIQLPVPNSAEEFFSQFALPDFAGLFEPGVWMTGVVIAVVASIETLLCTEATDKLDPLKRITPANTELRAQGIGNILCGLLGGLPITSVIVRSSANINAGARSKASTIVHGILLLACVVAVPAWLNHVPKAALAAVLIFTGYRLARPEVFKRIWRADKVNQFVPFVVTVLAVVFLDLLRGVGIGLLVSIFFILKQNARLSYYFQRSSFVNGDLIKLSLAQEVSFLNKASIKQTLERLPDHSAVIVDASHTEYIDFDVLEIIRDFARGRAIERSIKLSLIGFRKQYNLPKIASERDILNGVISAHDEVPRRTAGVSQDLLKQLRH
ncbi:SulP family inorganic anion transporter [Xylophilus sp. GOD-11R]|uniref:SulP family inorganic anion transporter n=1 Tax=Xylophilus sp. GOD-11R TaxID=3089814 RepID=UPI00298CFE11|nr:SulP family inorganic anion transporter [Xylophilus sp. GOD-11R]WPB56178.1 SulP family inorganic anion transporter [Xylophilus sp. GOD-11R]